MDIIEIMDQRHSGTARSLCYALGGKPLEIVDAWTARIGEENPLASIMDTAPAMTQEDAAEGAYWEIVRYAEKLYLAPMSREAALAVAAAITPAGKLHLADDVEFTDTDFVAAWNAAHPDQAAISRVVDIG